MSTDRNHILDRLASGQISADEAARLLRGPAESPPPPATELPPAQLANRWLRIRVTDLATGRQRVNVNLPLSWVQIGMKIGARYRPEIAGIDFAGLLHQIQSGANGKLIEVEDLEDDERVEIYVD